MANSLANSPGMLIAKRTLNTLLEMFPWLPRLAVDFSPESAYYGQTINVKLPSAFSAASTYSRANGYVSSNATFTDHPLVINQPKHVTYDFDDLERSSHSIPLIESFALNAAQALGLALVNDVLALVTVANYANETVNLASAFNRTAVNGVNKVLNGRKIPGLGRISVVNSDYYETLSNDTTIIANAGSLSDTVRSGHIGNVHGIRVEEYAQLPDNSESLAGFVCIPEAIMVAARTPTPPDLKSSNVLWENVTDENTGLSIQYRQYYDPTKGLEYRTYAMMYGVAVGNTACLERLVTA